MGKVNVAGLILYFIVGLSLGAKAFGGEESLDLEKVSATSAPSPIRSDLQNFKIMGRVDLTFDNTVNDRSELKQNHFLLFLKIKASPKVSFMGEFVGQSFAYVDYENHDSSKFTFGKVLVPFGDSQSFHHYYGGVQGYGVNGVMFPNIWAVPGLIYSKKIANADFDIFAVNGITAADETSDVDFQSTSSHRQAVGVRMTRGFLDSYKLIISTYYTDYWGARSLLLTGLDLSANYGSFGMKNFKIAAGIANGDIDPLPGQKRFSKTGDYLQISTNYFNSLEWRIRYGTYDNDDRIEDQNDIHSLNLGASFNLDVLKVLAEYQWNFEAVNETDNDIVRVMTSLDF